MRGRAIRAVALTVVAALVGGCSSDHEPSRAATTSSRAPASTSSSTTTLERPAGPANATGACDPVDAAACLLPWPNDRFTRADSTTPTGRRLDLPPSGMPANASGKRIDPTEWNRNDGFSPASQLLTVVPGVDPVASNLPPVTDIGASIAAGSSLVLVDLTDDTRFPAWAELDAGATDDAHRALIVVPAVALTEGHRFAVGLADLKRADGSAIRPDAEFARLVASPDADQQRWLAALARAGAPSDHLVVAWTFTVASAASLSGRLRHMWDETASALGPGAPPFTITSTLDRGPARIVAGTFQMPRYLTGDGGPGTVLDNGTAPDGVPVSHGTMTADFLCTVPAAASASRPVPMLLYGHGLLGSRDEVLDIGTLATSTNIGMCATDFLGMSAADVPTVLREFADLSGFRTQPDRMQQGHLAFLLLGRLLRSSAGFASAPEFRDASGRTFLDTSRLAFLGASQGGILGGASSAVTGDWDRVILAVGGLGYNTLLRRSVDFDEFAPPLRAAYPDELDQTIALDLIEQLWDRGENAGYAQHLTHDAYGRLDNKTVLLLEAFGDHQVANVATEKLARTLGVSLHTPSLAPGRSTDVTPQWGLPAIARSPFEGSALVVWDFGTPAPPVTNTPNRAGSDPHGKLSDVPAALVLLSGFVTGGVISDVCNGGPCHTDP